MGIFGFLFDPENKFGKLMTKIGIIVVTNLMFIFFSIPVITIGASYTAMYHVMLKEFRSKNDINPFTQFWNAFKSNFKQATICWIGAILLLGICWIGICICRIAGGIFLYIEYFIGIMGLFNILVLLYLFPTIAAFENTTKNLIKNSIIFILKKLWIAAIIFLLNVVSVAITFWDQVNQPLYVFCWFFFGFGFIAFLCSWLLLTVFKEYLPDAEEFEN